MAELESCLSLPLPLSRSLSFSFSHCLFISLSLVSYNIYSPSVIFFSPPVSLCFHIMDIGCHIGDLLAKVSGTGARTSEGYKMHGTKVWDQMWRYF